MLKYTRTFSARIRPYARSYGTYRTWVNSFSFVDDSEKITCLEVVKDFSIDDHSWMNKVPRTQIVNKSSALVQSLEGFEPAFTNPTLRNLRVEDFVKGLEDCLRAARGVRYLELKGNVPLTYQEVIRNLELDSIDVSEAYSQGEVCRIFSPTLRSIKLTSGDVVMGWYILKHIPNLRELIIKDDRVFCIDEDTLTRMRKDKPDIIVHYSHVVEPGGGTLL